MLRISQNSHASGAKSYYSTADYYSEGQELTGHWRGEAARRLGLDGDIKQPQWDSLCDNLNPQTGKRLTLRTDTDRTVGYDFNFHVPKSVSLLYAMTRDERLLDAFREAVDGTMCDMEAEINTRVRKGRKNENRCTGNMVWGEFVHFTARPVDHLPDPHLHAHCFVFNTTWDEEEHSWKAGQFRDLKRDAPYFEAVFHSRLAHRLAELGLPIQRTAERWELAGVSKPLIDRFSRRTAKIEERAREKGIDDPDAKAELGAKTRQRKQKDLSLPELQTAWRARMSPQELGALAGLQRKLGSDAAPLDETAAGRGLGFAIDHFFERSSVVPERKFLAAALRHSVGKAKVGQVLEAAAKSDSVIVGNRGGRKMATTRGVLKEEKKLVAFARKGRGRCKSLGKKKDRRKRDGLSEAQQQAVDHLLESNDQVLLLRGAAGVGKTTLMKQVVEEIEAGGTKVLAFAPSADASRGVLRSEGFNADTVARLLLDKKLQRDAAGQVIWIDEAGLLGVRHMAQVFDLAEDIDARVLLSGDRKQHGSVERGAALRLLEEEAGLVPAEVKDIRRQSGAYKEAVRALSDGQVEKGFNRLDALGWVKEAPSSERYQLLAADYIEAVAEGKTVLVVSPTHVEKDRITTHLRQALKDVGVLDRGERVFRVLEAVGLTEAERGDATNFQAGDVLQFHQNAKGFERGQRLEVNSTASLPLEHAKRFQLYRSSTLSLAPGDLVRITHNGRTADDKHRLDNGMVFQVRGFDDDGNIVLHNGWKLAKDWGHMQHGYVITSHASQGKTVDRVLIGQSSQSFGASSREQFYVSASRARERVTIYTDDKEALREAVRQTDDRLTATEFVNGPAMRQAESQRQRRPEIQRERKELVYER